MAAWPFPKIIAHRGAGMLAPENTLAAMRYAQAHGFRGVEFDVMLSKDKIPVLMHDPVFGRTVAGPGRVQDYSAAVLARCDVGSWFGPQFAAEPVPSFNTVTAFCRAAGIWMNVEIKPAPGWEHVTGEVVGKLARCLFDDLLPWAGPSVPNVAGLPPLLSSFSVAALQAAQRSAPDLPRALLAECLPDDWRDTCAAVGVIALHLNQKHLTPAVVRAVHAAGYGLFCYTVNDLARAGELLDFGVDAFCTDRPDLFGPDFAG